MNIKTIRKDIIDCDKKIFLDSAGASLMPKAVIEKITQYLKEELIIGGYAVQDSQIQKIEQFYVEVAKLINAQPHNVAFTHDATDAYIKTLSCIAFEPNDVIVTTDDDYGSNQIQFISLQKRFGIQIKRIKIVENGDLDLSNFAALVDEYKPKLVAVSHIPTNSGLVQNVKAIGAICNNKQVLFLVDACQSIGQMQVDVEAIQCDFLTATGRKFLRGPRGTGFLYVSDRVLNSGYYPLFIDGKGATWEKKDAFKIEPSAKRFETWERPCALKVGFIEALNYLNAIGIENIETYNTNLIEHFRQNLSSIPGVNLYDKGSKKCNILTFNKQHKSLEEITTNLKSNHVFFSVSHKHWGVIDFEKKGVDWLIRLSPHYFNTIEEIDKVSEIIERM